jgi:hypothetical protein
LAEISFHGRAADAREAPAVQHHLADQAQQAGQVLEEQQHGKAQLHHQRQAVLARAAVPACRWFPGV